MLNKYSIWIFIFLISITEGVAQKKNVILILIDDLGYSDIGAYGSTFYETPNIDKLAKEGYKFTNGYAASPVCSPTRASIMTGIYPSTIKNTDWFGAPQPEEAKKSKAFAHKKMLPASYEEELDLRRFTLAEAFKKNGYITMIAGKWHLGEKESHWPEFQGFDINKGGHAKGHPHSYFSPYHNPRLSDGPDGEYLGDRLTNEAINFMAESKSKPFFLYFPMYEVHTPIQAKPELIQKYEAKKKRLNLVDQFVDGEEGRKTRLNQSNPTYAAMVEAMDNCIGKLMSSLKELGLEKNTIVLFTSDNGGLSTSEGSPTTNIDLKAGKGWMYEGGIKVPFILKVPNAKPKEISTPVMSIDAFPTLLEYAGLKPKSVEKIDGVSLKYIINEKKEYKRDLYWHYPHYGNQGGAPFSAIRSGCNKLIYFYETDHVELYNLCIDPREQNDISKQDIKQTEKLLKNLKSWLKKTKVSMPIQNI